MVVGGKRTPEEWLEEEERHIAGRRADGEPDPWYEPPEYDNWRLWVGYQRRQRRLKHTSELLGVWLPKYVGADGKPDVTALAKALRITPVTVHQHLRRLIELGADFSCLRDWPHPLHGAIERPTADP